MPAFWTRMSSRPNRKRVASTRASTDSFRLTSVATNAASPCCDRRSAVARPSASRMSAMTTRAPSSIRRSAIAAPIPRAPPLTIATLPSTRPVMAVSGGAAEQRAHPLGDPRRLAVLEAHWREQDAAPIDRRRVGEYRGRPVLQALHQLERAHPESRLVEIERDPRHLFVIQETDRGVPEVREIIHQLLHQSAPAGAPCAGVLLDEQAKRRQQPDDLLLADLAPATDPVVRQALEPSLVDEMRRRRPQLVEHVEIEVLQGRSHDQIAPAAQDAGRLRAADRLAAGERDQIRPGFDEPSEVVG